jgi:hypothetical protein
MIHIAIEALATVLGGSDTYPNESAEHIGGLSASNGGAGPSEFTCWDAKDPDYRLCVPTDQLGAGRGNPWFIPRSYIANHPAAPAR